MRLFKKNKEIRISPKYYLLLQDKWAKKMSALTTNLSKQSLLVCLMLFVIITGSISFYNIYSSFFSEEYNHTDIGIRIKSKHLNETKVSMNVKNKTVLSKAEFENISSFKFYLDSLKQSKEGKKIYDSINNYRPDLVDSVVFIENYYKTNIKK